MHRTPIVSIIIAAYLRPQVLGWALRSVKQQTFDDWELIVVDDASDPMTAAAVASVMGEDPRVRYIALARNFGDQSGPNNVGVARSSGRYIAFLNQDDLWFPDHLQILVDWLEASGSDLVFGLNVQFARMTRADLEQQRWRGAIAETGRMGCYDPVTTFAPASSWLLTRACAQAVGPWQPGSTCRSAPAQEFLFRAWRRGRRLCGCPELTTLKFSTHDRPGCYVDAVDTEQAFFSSALDDPARLRTTILARAGVAERWPMQGRSRWVSTLLRGILRVAARLGISSLGLEMRARGLRRRGALIDWLREVRGLEALGDRWELGALRTAAVERTSRYQLGREIEFSGGGAGVLYQEYGWHRPEDWGTWTSGRRAAILLSLEEPLGQGGVLTIVGRAFVRGRCRSQRVEIELNGYPAVGFRCLSTAPWKLALPVPGEWMRKGGRLRVVLQLPDATTPKQAGVSADTRCLGLGVLRVSLSPQPGTDHLLAQDVSTGRSYGLFPIEAPETDNSARLNQNR